jgi:hypothetical protein
MAVVAKEHIKTKNCVHAPGAVIEGLSAAEEKRLANLGAVEVLTEQPVLPTEEEATDEEVETQELIKSALMMMTKAELTSYAASIDVQVDPKSNKNEMVEVLATHELYLDTLSTPALQILATGAGVKEDLPRNELIKLLSED